LPLIETAEAGALHCRNMYEHVLAEPMRTAATVLEPNSRKTAVQ
jgi:hypothetical protein